MDGKNLQKNPMLSVFEIGDSIITFTKEEFRTIFDSVSDGVLITDHNGWVLFYNKAFVRITGINFKQAIGKNVKYLVKNGFYSESVVLDVIEKCQPVTKMIRFLNNKEVMVTGIPIKNSRDELEKIVCTCRDLTELNAIKENLKKTKELYKNYERQLQEMKSNQLIKSKLVGHSSAITSIINTIQRVAKVDATVLITGESGTGKGVIAELIHKLSNRSQTGNFIHINCGAVPENLIESELFGYEKGAFTGARKEGKPGLMELADGGTLFLDEIGEMPLSLQVKLLNVLQTQEVMRIGGVKKRKVSVRFIAATHQNLDKMCKKGLFRSDLFYRLNIIPIYVPPLRHRKEDIVPLIYHFLKKLNKKYETDKILLPEVVDYFKTLSWPGNVRELENTLERLIIMVPHRAIGIEDLPKHLENVENPHVLSDEKTLKQIIENTERLAIQQAVETYATLNEAAKALGIDLSTLTRKKQKYNIYKNKKSMH
ncbi:MAG: hypothetical protein PWQ82_744 [Thermosediminibacterales bacterium]|nr:hypothetical protein [Thermosediminibacterales bacterium]MDK2836129.1 hypothetical protein [Thermosediminibacterales bacterium]